VAGIAIAGGFDAHILGLILILDLHRGLIKIMASAEAAGI